MTFLFTIEKREKEIGSKKIIASKEVDIIFFLIMLFAEDKKILGNIQLLIL